MFKRTIQGKLKEWYLKEKKHSLIIEGARQVGKTFIVREFGAEFYGGRFIEINFLLSPQFISFFDGDISPAALEQKFRIEFSERIVENEKILLFLDEI